MLHEWFTVNSKGSEESPSMSNNGSGVTPTGRRSRKGTGIKSNKDNGSKTETLVRLDSSEDQDGELSHS